MPKKGKKRREAQRARKIERAPDITGSPEEEAARLARARAKAEHEAERLRRKAKRERAAGINPLVVGIPIAVAAVAGVVAAVVLIAGGSGGDGTPATPTLNPIIGTATPSASIEVEARGEEEGSTFVPDTLNIDAGVVTEIVITNTAARVSHNMRVSGEDGEYETDDPANPKDDFAIPLIEAGETGRLVVKMDAPGSYKLQCDFHPQTQKGTLVVQ